MESTMLGFLALKMAFASSLGVMFGWQPMPDGSPKVEYIVQIEPGLAATLQEGQSIPITSDIPEGIGPIGRIRIVVGRDELPREKLVTNFKPWPKTQQHAGQSRTGIVETQFTVPPVQSSGSGRYGNQATASNSILPPSGNATGNSAAATSNPFGRALQQGAEQARTLASDVKQRILPPSGNELFGQSSASQGVQNAINNTTNQLSRGLQRGIEQVADQTGQQLRQAADNVGQGARNAVDQFGRSLTPGRSKLDNRQSQSNATILPPNSQPTSQRGKGRRIDQPPQQQPRRQQPQLGAPPASFAGSSPARTNPRSQPGVFDAPWPPTTGNSPAATPVGSPPTSRYSNQASQSPVQSSQWPSRTSNRDAFDLANLPSQNTGTRIAGGSQPEYGTTGSEMSGLRFPEVRNQSAGQLPTSQQYTDSNWPSRSPTPEIRDPKLGQPASGGRQTAVDMQGQGYQQTVGRQSFETPSQGAKSQGATSQGFSWNQNNSDSNYNNSDSNNSKTLFPLLLSWVLLSGSGAGNLYLFWSYLDVRNKYHGMVHSSPSRRERYDD